jgi:hypothetical protein
MKHVNLGITGARVKESLPTFENLVQQGKVRY